MDYYPERRSHFVRCLKCNKILKCSRYDTSALLEHIRTDHPEIEVIDSASQGKNPNVPPFNMNDLTSGGSMSACSPSGMRDMPNLSKCCEEPEINICDETTHTAMDGDKSDAKVIYTRRYTVNTPPPSFAAQTPRKRNLYRTSIEKWRPANGTIYCPKCCCSKRPLIKSRSERLSTNSCCAACVLGCWPFCFLPFICPGNNKEYLYCANCKNFLGLYDRSNNCVNPNREFVDYTETVHETTTNHCE